MHRFINLPLTDFTLASERGNFEKEVANIFQSVRNSPFQVECLGFTAKDFKSTFEFKNTLPEDNSIIFSSTGEPEVSHCEHVLAELNDSFSSWSKTTVSTRAEILEKAAKIMVSRRHELAATMVLEAGKSWIEADADLAEAVDFCDYYALEARRNFEWRKLGDYQGENNLYFYEPRGVSVVICPWNFPLAIPCGMFAASVVTGNCTILKPSEQTPVIAKKMFEIFLEAGLPKNVAAFIPGRGETVGDTLVKDYRTSTIVFTGSKDVGLKLIEAGGITDKRQKHVKRVVAEMGGKNAIIVDSDADIDEAVKGVLHSAFGFQGQKCSACSRVFVVSTHTFEIFSERLADAMKDLTVGPTSNPSSLVGPVIDNEAKEKITKYIQLGKEKHSILALADLPVNLVNKGNFIPPVIFSNVPEDSEIMTDEIFGPVLAVNMVSTFKEGIDNALNSAYRLTGGVFSRSPANIEYAMNNFNVGNLYINRACTGAIVYRQPFGGAYMSGVGSKAGGPDYLLQFIVPRVVTENTMRRGFAPHS